jgi:hypothetical protein
MAKTIERWLLYKYVEGGFTPLSKPFKTKAAAEKARVQIFGMGTQSDWGGCDSNKEVVRQQGCRVRNAPEAVGR